MSNVMTFSPSKQIDKTAVSDAALNLCLATPVFYPYYSGSAERYRRYLPGLQARDISPHVFTATPSANRVNTAVADDELNWQSQPIGTITTGKTQDNIPIARLRLSDNHGRRSHFQFGQTLVKYCQQTSQRFDVIQFVSLPVWASPWLLKLRQLNIPTVFAYTLLDQFAKNKFKRMLQRYYWQVPFYLTNCVVVNSQAMKSTLIELNVKANIEVIPNGVDTKRFQPATNQTERQALRQGQNIKPDETVLVTVGGVQPRKRTNLIIEAWYHLAVKEKEPVHLFIIGPRNEQKNIANTPFTQQIESLISTSGASQNVHFIEYTDQIEKYLKMADIFVFASEREGLPNAILEAMATELPVVTTPFMGMTSEIGNPGEHFLLVEPDGLAMSQAIQSLMNNHSLQKQYGRAGRNWIKTTMDLETSLDKYANLYLELAKSSFNNK